jgi:small subunit ribosomal protein S1
MAGQVLEHLTGHAEPTAIGVHPAHAVERAAALVRAFREARGWAVASYNHAYEERPVTEPEEDFATLFAASIQAKRFERGQTIEGTIVAIGREVAFVNVGGKGEAQLDIDELKDAEGALEVAVGDRIEAMVVSNDGGLTLSRKLARGAATLRQLEDAFRAGLPVEGRIERVVKGGYEVRIGGQRAFCPISQVDTVRTAAPEAHQGQVYAFRIIELEEGGKNLVVSRRALLEDEQKANAVEVRRKLVVDAVLTGRVASVRDFGAFVDLGAGGQGLLHVSEMAWSRVSDPSQLLSPGQEITVKVLRVEEDGQKVALGLKQLSADPWATVQVSYAVGQVRAGRVTRLADCGAFVELEPGVEGLAHASTFAPTGRADAWSRTVPVGTTGRFEILSIEPEKKRIGLALVPEGGVESAAELRDYAARTEVESSGAFGSLADKLRGALDSRRK